ncbi:hypothetical protein HK098_006856 [Nowakowskiella sp. JEL0407]|nr:hypothetical protein HK098_006856 [Nowakowskiella sp. JEL0407]
MESLRRKNVGQKKLWDTSRKFRVTSLRNKKRHSPLIEFGNTTLLSLIGNLPFSSVYHTLSYIPNMRLSSVIVAAFFAFVSTVSAKPGRSPICDTETAAAAIKASAMGENKRNLATENAFSLTSSSPSYTPGQQITLTLTGTTGYAGILLYVAPVSDATKRVGKFVIPDGYQNNDGVCQNSDFPDSSITHKLSGAYPKDGTFTYTAPATDLGNIAFHLIIVTQETGGFGWGVWNSALELTGGAGAQAAVTNAGEANIPIATPTPEVAGGNQSPCEPPKTMSKFKKCTLKNEFRTTIINKVTTVHTIKATTTVETTVTEVKTKTEKFTPQCTANPSDVLGNQEVPTSMYETPMPMMETPTPMYDNNYNNYGDNYGYGSGY